MENTQPEGIAVVNESNQHAENKQYLRYKDRFKKMGIFNIVSSVCALILIVLLIFVKSFVVKVKGVAILQFSIYDEVVRSIKIITSGDSGILALLEIYSVIAFIMFLGVAVTAIVDLIKNILNVTNLEKYALTQYDNIKRRSEDNGKKRKKGNSSILHMLVSSIVFEIMGIFYSRFLSGLFNEEGTKYGSYFASVNGVSFNIIFAIIFAIAFAVLYFIMRKIFKDIKYEIMKEEYGT